VEEKRSSYDKCSICGGQIDTEFEAIQKKCMACMAAEIKDNMRSIVAFLEEFHQKTNTTKTSSGIHISDTEVDPLVKIKNLENSQDVLLGTMKNSLMFMTMMAVNQVMLMNILKDNNVNWNSIDELMRPVIMKTKQTIEEAATAAVAKQTPDKTIEPKKD